MPTIDNTYASATPDANISGGAEGVRDLVFQNFNFGFGQNAQALTNIYITVTGAAAGGVAPWVMPYLIRKELPTDDVSQPDAYNRARKSRGRKIMCVANGANKSTTLLRNSMSDHMIHTHGSCINTAQDAYIGDELLTIADLRGGHFAVGLKFGGSSNTNTFRVDALEVLVKVSTLQMVFEKITPFYFNDGALTDSRSLPLSDQIFLETKAGESYRYTSCIGGYAKLPNDVTTPLETQSTHDAAQGLARIDTITVTEFKR